MCFVQLSWSGFICGLVSNQDGIVWNDRLLLVSCRLRIVIVSFTAFSLAPKVFYCYFLSFVLSFFFKDITAIYLLRLRVVTTSRSKIEKKNWIFKIGLLINHSCTKDLTWKNGCCRTFFRIKLDYKPFWNVIIAIVLLIIAIFWNVIIATFISWQYLIIRMFFSVVHPVLFLFCNIYAHAFRSQTCIFHFSRNCTEPP